MSLANTSTSVIGEPACTRRGTVIVGVIAASAFGPYLPAGSSSELSGLRTEQLAVYATAMLLAIAVPWSWTRPPRVAVVVISLLSCELLVTAIGAVEPPQNTTSYQPGPPLAGIDNLLLPIATITIVCALVGAGADRLQMIDTTCLITVWAMVVNSPLAFWSVMGGGPDLSHFHTPTGSESVAFYAAQLGRFSGVFNQPAEAGMMYSIALIAAVYLYRERPVLLGLVSAALCAGGILTVSKIFLLVGLPVALWQILRTSGGRIRRLLAMTAIGLMILAVVNSGLAPEWSGGAYLRRLLPGSDEDFITLYSAGRYGDESTLAVVVDAVLQNSPLFGFGAGGLQVPYDNGWVEALVMGGLCGAIIHTTVLVVLGAVWWSARRGESEPLVRLAGGLLAVAAGAALGVPSLTANRCATITWLLLTLLLLGTDTGTLRVRHVESGRCRVRGKVRR